jgi:hypothetical protein
VGAQGIPTLHGVLPSLLPLQLLLHWQKKKNEKDGSSRNIQIHCQSLQLALQAVEKRRIQNRTLTVRACSIRLDECLVDHLLLERLSGVAFRCCRRRLSHRQRQQQTSLPSYQVPMSLIRAAQKLASDLENQNCSRMTQVLLPKWRDEVLSGES